MVVYHSLHIFIYTFILNIYVKKERMKKTTAHMKEGKRNEKLFAFSYRCFTFSKKEIL